MYQLPITIPWSKDVKWLETQDLNQDLMHSWLMEQQQVGWLFRHWEESIQMYLSTFIELDMVHLPDQKTLLDTQF